MSDVLNFRYDWREPYRWRTNLRGHLPWCLNRLFGKGLDCEAVGGIHQWYNIDNETSGCYHCVVIREGQLWNTQADDISN